MSSSFRAFTSNRHYAVHVKRERAELVRDLEEILSQLRRAATPGAELRRFGADLRKMYIERVTELGVAGNSAARFAAFGMLEPRLRSAERHLLPENVDPVVFAEYLTMARELSAELFEQAESGEDLA